LASDGLLLGMRRGHGPPAPGQRTSGHGSRTSATALHMSAIGVKADMPFYTAHVCF